MICYVPDHKQMLNIPLAELPWLYHNLSFLQFNFQLIQFGSTHDLRINKFFILPFMEIINRNMFTDGAELT